MAVLQRNGIISVNTSVNFAFLFSFLDTSDYVVY